MNISIDAMLSDLDGVRNSVLRLHPEDALRIEFLLFSRAFPEFIAPPPKELLELSFSRLRKLATYDASQFAKAQSDIENWSEGLSLTYLVLSTWNPITKARYSVAVKKAEVDAGSYHTARNSNLFYALTLSSRTSTEKHNTSLTQFVGRFSGRKPLLVTSFDGNADGVDIAVPAIELEDALNEIVESIDTPDWFNCWGSQLIQALYRGTVLDNRGRHKILRYGERLSAAIKDSYHSVSKKSREELGRQARALQYKLSLSDEALLTEEIMYTFWITQLLWRRVISDSTTHYMYLIPKAFGEGTSILTYGSKRRLTHENVLSLRAFSKETLSVHLSHQLQHHAAVSASNVNRVFTGHNLPRAFGHLTRRYIPRVKRLLDRVGEPQLRHDILLNIGAMDKYLKHYYFLMKSWLQSADIQDMAIEIMEERIPSDDIKSLIMSTFFLSRDDLGDRDFAESLSPNIELRLEEETERNYSRHLLTEVLITVLSNAARYTASYPRHQLPSRQIPITVSEEEGGFLSIVVKNFCGRDQQENVVQCQAAIDEIFRSPDVAELSKVLDRLINAAMLNARDGQLGVGVATACGYLKCLDLMAPEPSRASYRLKFDEISNTVTTSVRLPI